jgi:hypothetical protein
VLTVGDQFVFSEPLEGKGAVLDRAVPGQEMAQVVAVAAQGCRCEVRPGRSPPADVLDVKASPKLYQPA